MMRRRAYGDLGRIEFIVEVTEEQENQIIFQLHGASTIDYGDGFISTGTGLVSHMYEVEGEHSIVAYGKISVISIYSSAYRGIIKEIRIFNCLNLSNLLLSPSSTIKLSIDKLDLSGCPNLKQLTISQSDLSELDLSELSKLTNISTTDNSKLSQINLPFNSVVTTISIRNNSIKTLDLSKQLICKTINVSNNGLETLLLPKTETLTSLICDTNNLTSLEVLYYKNLLTLSCSSNKIAELDVTSNLKLTSLNCASNLLSRLDVTQNTELKTLQCYRNPFASETEVVSLDLTYNLLLEDLQCQLCYLDEIINIENLVNLKKLYVAYYDWQFPNQVNRLQSLDLRLLSNLTNLYIGLQSLRELWLPNPDENNQSSIKVIKSINNSSATAIPITIHNLSGVKMECDLTLFNHILQGDYDLSNIDYYTLNAYNIDFSIVSIQATGKLRLKEYINRDWIYNKDVVNGAPPCFIFKANTFEIVCEDGSIITDKAEYYRHLAEVVVAEELYDYPQHNKIISPVYALNETREMYDTHKILLCDSGDQNSWQNRYSQTGLSVVTNRSNIVWQQSFYVSLDNNTTNTFKLVIKEGADFYITSAYDGYYSHDTRQRFVIENGELVGKNGATVNSKTVLENGDIEYNISANFVVNKPLYNYGKYAYLFENMYPFESDHYISKIVSFEKIE